MKLTTDLKRDAVKGVFNKILNEDTTLLTPKSLLIKEEYDKGKTEVDFSLYREQKNKRDVLSFEKCQGKGFVDAIFTRCHLHFLEEYASLQNISLVDIKMTPDFITSKKVSGTDAASRVTFRMQVKDHGISEFCSESYSFVAASYRAVLSAFQFYINCDKTFKKLHLIRNDALSRNRSDIVQACLYDMSKITEVNCYDTKGQI